MLPASNVHRRVTMGTRKELRCEAYLSANRLETQRSWLTSTASDCGVSFDEVACRFQRKTLRTEPFLQNRRAITASIDRSLNFVELRQCLCTNQSKPYPVRVWRSEASPAALREVIGSRRSPVSRRTIFRAALIGIGLVARPNMSRQRGYNLWCS